MNAIAQARDAGDWKKVLQLATKSSRSLQDGLAHFHLH
jgi:hypothetical protein